MGSGTLYEVTRYEEWPGMGSGQVWGVDELTIAGRAAPPP